MMKTKAVFLLLIAAALMFTGCGKEEEVPDNFIARVNNSYLTLQDIDSMIGMNDWKQMKQKDKSEFIDNWISLQLFALKSIELGYNENHVIKKKIENAGTKILANSYINSFLSDFELTEEEKFAYYRAHSADFAHMVTQYKVQRITVKSKDKMKLVLDSLNAGMKFKDAARKYSEDNMASKGGYLGFKSRKDLDPIVWNKLGELQGKYYYGYVELPDHYEIVRYYDTRKVEATKEYNTVKEEIEETLMALKQKDIINNKLENLKENADIEIMGAL